MPFLCGNGCWGRRGELLYGALRSCVLRTRSHFAALARGCHGGQPVRKALSKTFCSAKPLAHPRPAPHGKSFSSGLRRSATRSTGTFQSSLKRETPVSLRDDAGHRFSGDEKNPPKRVFLFWCPKEDSNLHTVAGART